MIEHFLIRTGRGDEHLAFFDARDPKFQASSGQFAGHNVIIVEVYDAQDRDFTEASILLMLYQKMKEAREEYKKESSRGADLDKLLSLRCDYGDVIQLASIIDLRAAAVLGEASYVSTIAGVLKEIAKGKIQILYR